MINSKFLWSYLLRIDHIFKIIKWFDTAPPNSNIEIGLFDC